MLVYVDSSVLARAYLPDEAGHAEAAALLTGTDHLLATATWTIVREHALRSLAAMHLAVATLATLAAVPPLDPGDALGLASRDEAQRQAGIALGFVEVREALNVMPGVHRRVMLGLMHDEADHGDA